VTESAIELATLDMCSLALNLQKASLRRTSSTKAGFVRRRFAAGGAERRKVEGRDERSDSTRGSSNLTSALICRRPLGNEAECNEEKCLGCRTVYPASF